MPRPTDTPTDTKTDGPTLITRRTRKRASHRRDPNPGTTKTTRLAYERAIAHLRELEHDGDYLFDVRREVPEAWDTLEQDVDVWEKKVKVTLRLDESVAKFYRALGVGYQERINRVLATYAQLKIANVRLADARVEAIRREIREREDR